MKFFNDVTQERQRIIVRKNVIWAHRIQNNLTQASRISSISRCEGSTRFTLSGTFRLITEKNVPILMVSTTVIFSFTKTCHSRWMQSKVYTRQDSELKGQSLQDGCRLFSDKFFFQTQQQSHEQAEELFSVYIVLRLMQGRVPVQKSMLWGDLGRLSW
ncbi:hypothetical protein TNCV_4009391 [Trichonephila clavipes]|nr:hypothetical protein TNCV_4009391 [Trichonephila clavipes]